MPGGPAESTRKIILGDELITVDGYNVQGQTLADIVNLIWYVFKPWDLSSQREMIGERGTMILHPVLVS